MNIELYKQFIEYWALQAVAEPGVTLLGLWREYVVKVD